MERPGPRFVQPLPVAGAHVLEPDLPARSGKADLAPMQVAREDQVVRIRRQPLGHVREVEQEDGEIGGWIRQLLETTFTPSDRRVPTRDLHPTPVHLENDR
jgi:hypothetical protein